MPDFSENHTYLERVTVPTREEAVEILMRESGMNADEFNPQPIFMRYVEGAEAEELMKEDGPAAAAEWPEFWLECEEGHPDAVPWWKDLEG